MSTSAGILIIGATSAIASATARLFAAEGCSFFLVGRNEARLRSVADDLVIRGALDAHLSVMDLNETELHDGMVQEAIGVLGRIDIALVAHGTLPDQGMAEESRQAALDSFRTNALSTISVLASLAGALERQRGGTIAVISSVAGDRGRQSNYIYGSAKAAVDAYAQGLRNRLHGAGVHVLTIKPGLTDSPMTAHLPKNSLYSDVETVAKGIQRAIRKKKNVAYVPGYWRIVMGMIKAIPEPVFKRLKL